MEFSLSTLGCALPSLLSPRRQLARPSVGRVTPPLNTYHPQDCKRIPHRDSLFLYSTTKNNNTSKSNKAPKELHGAPNLAAEELEEEDDDTASTLSLTSASSDEVEEEDDDDDLLDYFGNASFSLFSSTAAASKKKQRVVRFATPLVTEIRTRPMTTKSDKYYLHYNEHDYMDFKIELLTGRVRTRRVSFSRDVVSDVQTTVTVAENVKKELFYTESELQGFLDDFVRSLNQKLSS